MNLPILIKLFNKILEEKEYSKKLKTKIMKTINKFKIAFAVMIFSVVTISSCQKEENLNPVVNSSTEDLVQQVKTKNYFNTKSACNEDLIQDAGQCLYTSGEGKDMTNRFDMVDMLNNCHIDPLPNGCSWLGNTTTTEMIDVPLNNCCSPFNSLNGKLLSWKNTAIANKPSGNYAVTGYEALGGIMMNGGYGPYLFKIRVTYRKHKNCYTQHVPSRK